MKPIKWDIRREGRQWSNEEFDQRLDQSFEKIEFVGGIFASERCGAELDANRAPEERSA